jgi:hypothetical protein
VAERQVPTKLHLMTSCEKEMPQIDLSRRR